MSICNLSLAQPRGRPIDVRHHNSTTINVAKQPTPNATQDVFRRTFYARLNTQQPMSNAKRHVCRRNIQRSRRSRTPNSSFSAATFSLQLNGTCRSRNDTYPASSFFSWSLCYSYVAAMASALSGAAVATRSLAVCKSGYWIMSPVGSIGYPVFGVSTPGTIDDSCSGFLRVQRV